MMAYENLSDFLAELRDDDDLVRVSAEVDSYLEITEIAERLKNTSSDEGPTVIFDNVKGHSIPLVVNLLGTRRRMLKALGVNDFDEIAGRIAGLVRPAVPESWLDALQLVPHFSQLAKLPPEIVKKGDCQQIVKVGRDVDLHELPIPHFWPNESGPTITMGQVYTKDPETGVRDVGLYALQVQSSQSLTVHWTLHDDGYDNLVKYRQREESMPVAVALGGDPLLAYMAATPLPLQTDECLWGGFLRNQNIELVKCRSVDLEVPAQAEIVLEGTIDPVTSLETGRTVSTSTGYYSVPEEAPLLQVSALTQRSNPYFPALIHRPLESEDYWMKKTTERVFLPLVRLAVPEVVDYHLPRSGVYRNLVFVSIRKRYPQQARKVMHALWSLGRLMVSKMIVVVDAEVDVHDEEQVWFSVGAHAHPGRDTVFCEGPTDAHDHAAPVRGMGHKMGIDATRKLAEEGHTRPWPDQLNMNQEIRERVTRRWSEYGFDGPKGDVSP